MNFRCFTEACNNDTLGVQRHPRHRNGNSGHRLRATHHPGSVQTFIG